MSEMAIRLRFDFGKFIIAFLLMALLTTLIFAFGRRAAVAPGASDVPLKPCSTCASCKCPKLLGSISCGCPR